MVFVDGEILLIFQRFFKEMGWISLGEAMNEIIIERMRRMDRNRE